MWSKALILGIVVLPMLGCGTAFSGGTIPPGGSRLVGRVVSAQNPLSALSNVTVTVLATPKGGTTQTLQMTTGEDGIFDFSKVSTGAGSGTIQVKAVPSGSDFQSQQIAFQGTNGHTDQLIMALPRSTVDINSAKTLQLSPPLAFLPAGDTIQITAQLRDASGNLLSITPTLLFDGNFGTISGDGTFFVPSGTGAGTGTITAYWYSLPPQVSQISVDNTLAPAPPPVPMLPRSGGSDPTPIK